MIYKSDKPPSQIAPVASGERDLSMDFLKGFACILMVIAHTPLTYSDTPGSWLIRIAIGPCTAIFFGTAAHAALLQRKRYGLRATLLTYLWLFLLGANMTPLMQHFERFAVFTFIEMLSIIALGSLLVLVVDEWLCPNRWGYLAIALAIAIFKFALDHFFSNTQWPLIFAVPKGSIQYLPDGAALSYPGFSLLPWLFVFPFIQFVRKSSVLSNLIVSAFCSFGVVLLVTVGVATDLQVDIFNKWDQTPAYLLMTGALNCFFFAIFAPNEKVLPFKPVWVIWLGRNSLAFLYAHIFGIVFSSMIIFFCVNNDAILIKWLPSVKLIRQYLFWALAILLSLQFTKLIVKISPSRLFQYLPPWFVLALLIYLIPLAIDHFALVWLFEYLLGIVLVVHLPLLISRLRKNA